MADKSFRIINILKKIPIEPGFITTNELMELLSLENPDYEVSIRTIQRDLHELSGKLPIVVKKNKWSYMKEGKIFQLPEMNFEIALGFKLIDSFLYNILPKSVVDFLKPYAKNADEILERNTNNQNYKKWAEKVEVISLNPLHEAKIEENIVHTVYEAVFQQKVLKVLHYQKGDNEPESFETDPLGIVLRDNTLYLVCTSAKNKNILFRPLHRMKKVEILDKYFKVPEGFNLKKYIQDGEFEWILSKKKMKFEAEIDSFIAFQFFERELSSDQKIVYLENGNILVKATVQDTNNFRFFLHSLADNVRVIKPKRLANEFRQVAENLAYLYDSES